MGKKNSDISSTPVLPVPHGVHGLFLLAKVFHKSGRCTLAIEYYRKCIRVDSYHFGAIMALTELGGNPNFPPYSSSVSNGKGTTKATWKALQSKDCLIPKRVSSTKSGNSSNGKQEADDDDEENLQMVPLEKEDPNSYRAVKTLFEHLGWGYFKLQIYEPQDALRHFVKLSTAHQESAWCLNNKARCYYEMNDYQRV